MTTLMAEPDHEKIDRLLSVLDDLPDEEVAAFFDMANQRLDYWKWAKERAKGSLLRRLHADEAGQILAPREHPEWLITETPARAEWQWDGHLLRALQAFMTRAEFEAMFEEVPATLRVKNTRSLQAMAKKRKGQFAEIVERAGKRIEKGTPSIDVQPILEG